MMIVTMMTMMIEPAVTPTTIHKVDDDDDFVSGRGFRGCPSKTRFSSGSTYREKYVADVGENEEEEEVDNEKEEEDDDVVDENEDDVVDED